VGSPQSETMGERPNSDRSDIKMSAGIHKTA